jgi:hypothetical protein
MRMFRGAIVTVFVALLLMGTEWANAAQIRCQSAQATPHRTGSAVVAQSCGSEGCCERRTCQCYYGPGGRPITCATR